MQISIIIPLFNEEASLAELVNWIRKVMTENNFSYEIIMIDDGSQDKSWHEIEKLAAQDTSTKAIRFRKN